MKAETLQLDGPAGPVWRRYVQRDPDLASRLAGEAGLDALTIDMLVASETRPRCTPHEGGVILILRGVNLNPGSDPEDMVSVRVWLDESQVVTVQLRSVLSLDEVSDRIRAGAGPKTPGDFIVALAEALAEHMQETIESLEEELDLLEDELAEKPAAGLRAKITRLRRQLVTLRRFMHPRETRSVSSMPRTSPGRRAYRTGACAIRSIRSRGSSNSSTKCTRAPPSFRKR